MSISGRENYTTAEKLKLAGLLDSTGFSAYVTSNNIAVASKEPIIIKNTGFNLMLETLAANIKMDGVTSVGSLSTIARADHIHPTDTSLAPKASPTFTGTVIMPAATSIGSTTSTELGYVHGLTSSIQTQLGLLAPMASPTFTGTVVLPSTTSIGTTTSAELGYVHGLTSPIQTQLGLLAPKASPTFTGVVTLPTNSISDSLLISLNAAVVAAGTTQATATALTKDENIIASGTGGVVVQGATTGKIVIISNMTASPVNVYPAVGHYFDKFAINIPISLPANGYLELIGFSTTQWTTTLNAIIDFTKIINTPTTVGGYHITDAVKTTNVLASINASSEDVSLLLNNQFNIVANTGEAALSTFSPSKTILGAIHINPGCGLDATHKNQAGITFDNGSGVVVAGIYTTIDGATGSAMAFATTGAWSTGGQIGLSITSSGSVAIPRSSLTIATTLAIGGATTATGAINANGGITVAGSIHTPTGLGTSAQLVGDYVNSTTANKMIWTFGDNWNTWATQYGLSYEYGTFAGSAIDHQLTIRGAGATHTRFGLTTGNIATDGNIISSGYMQADNYTVGAVSGQGYCFWGDTSNYKMYMAQSSLSGRYGETTSDYNMYFTMAGVTRGFQFANSSYLGGAPFASITPQSGGQFQSVSVNHVLYGNGSLLQLGIGSGSNAIYLDGATIFRTSSDNVMTLGYPTFRWGQIYSSVSTISTSDRNEKNTIESLDATKAINFLMAINPVSYKLNDGTSGRFHYGMIAQDIEDEMTALGMTSLDFAGFIKSPKTEAVETTDEDGNTLFAHNEIDGEFIYGLRYEEFISPIIKVVQQLLNRVTSLEAEVQALKSA